MFAKEVWARMAKWIGWSLLRLSDQVENSDISAWWEELIAKAPKQPRKQIPMVFIYTLEHLERAQQQDIPTLRFTRSNSFL